MVTDTRTTDIVRYLQRVNSVILGLFLTGCFFIPLGYIVVRSLTGASVGNLSSVWDVVVATLSQAVLSTLLALACALPIAWAVTVFPGRLARWVLVWCAVPFVIPTPVAATLMVAVCGPRTVCGQAMGIEVAAGYGFVLVVHAWYNTGVLVRLVSQAWQRISARYDAAAATLSATAWQRWWDVTLPLLWPSVASGVAVVMVYCIGSFGVIVLLGGGAVVSIEVEIWRQTVQFLRLDRATTLAVSQLLLSVGLLWYAERMGARVTLAPVPQLRPHPHRSRRLVAASVLVVALVACVVPFAALVPRAFGLSNFWTAFDALQQPIRGTGITVSPLVTLLRSFGIAALVSLLCVWFGWWATAPGSVLRRVAVLPMGVSTITLSLGYVLWFGALGLLTAQWLLIAVHVLLALPLVTRQIAVARERLPATYDAAAATLGAPPVRRLWEIELPLLRRPVFAAGLLGFAVSLGDYAAALVLSRPESVTAPVMIGRLLQRPGALNYATSAALSVVFVLCCAAVMAVIEYATGDRERSE